MITSRRRCAACKYLRRKCPQNCIFSPYFPCNDPQRFACVHRIYGAKNVAKMLQELPVDRRAQAAESMYMEAQHRIEEPVYGCVRIISQLHQEIQNVETQLAQTRAEIALASSNNNINNSNNNNNNVQDHDQAHHHDDHNQMLDSHDDRSDLNHLILQAQQSGSSNQASWI